MNLLLKELLYGLLATVAAAGTCIGVAGCAIPIEGNGEFGFRQSTSWGFYRSTEKADPADKSTIALDVSPAVDLLIKLDEAKRNPGTASDPAP